jgi:competence protein ComEA
VHPYHPDGGAAPVGPPMPPRPPLSASVPGGVVDRARDAVARWRTDWRAGAALLAVVAALAGFLWYRAGAAVPPPVAAATAGSADDAPSTTSTAAGAGAGGAAPPASPAVAEPTTAASTMVVHVAGAVVVPGVYGLAPGARVRDAVNAAGGPAADAALDELNLATPLADGQRVEVPHLGDPDGSGGVSGGVPVAAGPPGSGGPPTSSAPLDLNRATEAELDTLPGVGPSIAAAIVAQREAVGGFDAVEDLLEVRGIGEARLAELQPLVTV